MIVTTHFKIVKTRHNKEQELNTLPETKPNTICIHFEAFENLHVVYRGFSGRFSLSNM